MDLVLLHSVKQLKNTGLKGLIKDLGIYLYHNSDPFRIKKRKQLITVIFLKLVTIGSKIENNWSGGIKIYKNEMPISCMHLILV